MKLASLLVLGTAIVQGALDFTLGGTAPLLKESASSFRPIDAQGDPHCIATQDAGGVEVCADLKVNFRIEACSVVAGQVNAIADDFDAGFGTRVCDIAFTKLPSGAPYVATNYRSNVAGVRPTDAQNTYTCDFGIKADNLVEADECFKATVAGVQATSVVTKRLRAQLLLLAI